MHGSGSVVVVPARIAAWLNRSARLRELRTAVRGIDAELDAVLVALAVAAAAWHRHVGLGTDPGTEQDGHADTDPGSLLSTSQTAAVLGISERAVRKAIAVNRLPAQRAGNAWLIRHDDAEHFRAARSG